MCDIPKYSPFIPPQKLLELQKALSTPSHIILQGPPGCAKTHTLHSLLQTTQTSYEYIDNPLKLTYYPSKSLLITDIDTKDIIYQLSNQLKHKLSNITRIIIETRCIFQTQEYLEKLSTMFILIKFNKITDARIKKHSRNVSGVNGNLHRLFMEGGYLYNGQELGVCDFYHFLGKIFYGNLDKLEEIRGVEFEKNKVVSYIRANCVYFMGVGDVVRLMDLMSGGDDVNVYLYFILSCKKKKPESFYGFKSLKLMNQKKDKLDYF